MSHPEWTDEQVFEQLQNNYKPAMEALALYEKRSALYQVAHEELERRAKSLFGVLVKDKKGDYSKKHDLTLPYVGSYSAGERDKLLAEGWPEETLQSPFVSGYGVVLYGKKVGIFASKKRALIAAFCAFNGFAIPDWC